MSKIRTRQAIALALQHEMEADPRVIVLGEDVGAAGGVFKATEGLIKQFGPERVRDTPISEMGFLGAAVGAAMTGLRPVVEIMFMDFLGVALDQLVTQAAKIRYLTGGQYGIPLVVRGSAGAGLGYAAQHSQSIEPWVLSTAGLKVVSPSRPATAYGLMRAAIADPDPVLVIEPRNLYGEREEFDPAQYAHLQLGQAAVARNGDDITVVALGSSVAPALEAAAGANFSAEVIDLLTLAPADFCTVSASLRRTRRLAIIEHGPYTGGWGATLASTLAARHFGHLEAPVLRITAPDVPIPYARNLERRTVATAPDITQQINELLTTNRLPEPWWSHVN